MPKYTLDVKAAIANELVEAFSDTYGYQAEFAGLGGVVTQNPETAAAFTKRKIMEFPKEVLKAYREKQAKLAASSTPVADTDITIT